MLALTGALGLGVIVAYVNAKREASFWTKKPAERIAIMKELFQKGHYAKTPPIYYANLSACHFDNGDYEQALDLISQAEALPEKNPVFEQAIEQSKAVILLHLGRQEEGTAILERLDKINGLQDSIMFNVKSNLGVLALQRGDIDRAKACLFAMKAINARFEDDYWFIKRNDDMLMLQAEIEFTEGYVDQAAKSAEAVLDRSDSHPVIKRAEKLLERWKAFVPAD